MYEQLAGIGLANLMGVSASAHQGQYGYQNQHSPLQGQTAAQQQYQWAQHMAQQKPQWVFNGVKCNSAREMADIIWPNDCPEKTWFILKFE